MLAALESAGVIRLLESGTGFAEQIPGGAVVALDLSEILAVLEPRDQRRRIVDHPPGLTFEGVDLPPLVDEEADTDQDDESEEGQDPLHRCDGDTVPAATRLFPTVHFVRHGLGSVM